MKQARLNSNVLLSKYDDMLDALDLNSEANARQINLYFIITAHMELQDCSNNLMFIIYHMFFMEQSN